jgi:hypothetical protein
MPEQEDHEGDQQKPRKRLLPSSCPLPPSRPE